MPRRSFTQRECCEVPRPSPCYHRRCMDNTGTLKRPNTQFFLFVAVRRGTAPSTRTCLAKSMPLSVTFHPACPPREIRSNRRLAGISQDIVLSWPRFQTYPFRCLSFLANEVTHTACRKTQGQQAATAIAHLAVDPRLLPPTRARVPLRTSCSQCWEAPITLRLQGGAGRRAGRVFTYSRKQNGKPTEPAGCLQGLPLLPSSIGITTHIRRAKSTFRLRRALSYPRGYQ